jgi:Fe2+ or Zn2+ uptake regulation protein
MNQLKHLEHDHLAGRLRSAGLKATAPRLAILSALEEDRRHPSAEMIHESLVGDHPTLSLSTIYTTLETFVQKGLIRRIGTTGARVRVDGTPPDHDHAVCKRCGEVFDVDRSLLPRPEPPERLPDGMRVTSLYVEYEVVCATCSDTRPSS